MLGYGMSLYFKVSYSPIIGNRFALPSKPFIRPIIPSINMPIPKIGSIIHPITGIIPYSFTPSRTAIRGTTKIFKVPWMKLICYYFYRKRRNVYGY